MPDEVRYERAGPVACVTLDRPQALNALGRTAREALLAAVREAASDDAVRAVVVTGTGAEAFCAGEDLRELQDAYAAGPVDLSVTLREHWNPVVLTLATMPKPVVAALNGVAAGAGVGLALACDLRWAARGSSLVLSFATVGLTADAGVSFTLQRLVGPARATAMLLLPERVDAERALELGLVTAVVPDESLRDSAAELAARLAAGPTGAYAATKASLAHAASSDLASALAFEAVQQAGCSTGPDHREGVAAFFGRRRPTFGGR